MRNRYSGTCSLCGQHVPAGGGSLMKFRGRSGRFELVHYVCPEKPAKAPHKAATLPQEVTA
jgi:hypothetical protein